MKVLLDSVDQIAEAMTFHRERHAVLAGNVANIDTPGFAPRDLIAPEAAEGAAPLERTNAAHLQAPVESASGEVIEDPNGEARQDGNSVSLERELAKIDANRLRYAVASQLVSKRLALIRYTAGDGG